MGDGRGGEGGFLVNGGGGREMRYEYTCMEWNNVIVFGDAGFHFGYAERECGCVGIGREGKGGLFEKPRRGLVGLLRLVWVCLG